MISDIKLCHFTQTSPDQTKRECQAQRNRVLSSVQEARENDIVQRNDRRGINYFRALHLTTTTRTGRPWRLPETKRINVDVLTTISHGQFIITRASLM